MAAPDFHGMSDEELETFILTFPDRYDIPGALFEHKHRQDARAAKAAAKLEQQTDRLVQQTDVLVSYTRRLYWLTLVLAVFAIFEVIEVIFQLADHLAKTP
jgi:hypothetical protein